MKKVVFVFISLMLVSSVFAQIGGRRYSRWSNISKKKIDLRTMTVVPRNTYNFLGSVNKGDSTLYRFKNQHEQITGFSLLRLDVCSGLEQISCNEISNGYEQVITEAGELSIFLDKEELKSCDSDPTFLVFDFTDESGNDYDDFSFPLCT